MKSKKFYPTRSIDLFLIFLLFVYYHKFLNIENGITNTKMISIIMNDIFHIYSDTLQ